MSVLEVKNNKLVELNSNQFMVVDFTASWCPPCKMMKPIFHSIAEEEHLQNVVFAAVDVDENQELSQKYGVMSIPTFLILQNKGGEFVEVKRMVGGQDPITFKTSIEDIVKDSV